jgi:hypothetical protein
LRLHSIEFHPLRGCQLNLQYQSHFYNLWGFDNSGDLHDSDEPNGFDELNEISPFSHDQEDKSFD